MTPTRKFLATAMMGSLGLGCSSQTLGTSNATDEQLGAAVQMCYERAGGSLQSQRSFTDRAIRWAARDVDNDTSGNPVTGRNRGQEYTEYFAILKDPADIANSDAEGYGAAIYNTNSYPINQVSASLDATDEVGKCVFTSWHRDVSEHPGRYSGDLNDSERFLQTAGFDPTNPGNFKMKVGFNSNAAAGDLLANCLHPSAIDNPNKLDPETQADAIDDTIFAIEDILRATIGRGFPFIDSTDSMDQYARGCFNASTSGSAGFGTEWRRSDSAVCVVGNRLHDCGCSITADSVVEVRGLGEGIEEEPETTKFRLTLPLRAPAFGDPAWLELWPLVADYWSESVGNLPRMDAAQVIREEIDAAIEEDRDDGESGVVVSDEASIEFEPCDDDRVCAETEEGKSKLRGEAAEELEAEVDRRVRTGALREDVLAEIQAEHAREYELMSHWYRQFIGAHVVPAVVDGVTPGVVDASGQVPYYPGFRLGTWPEDDGGLDTVLGELPDGCEYIRDASYEDANEDINSDILVACPYTKAMLDDSASDPGEACKQATYANDIVVHVPLDFGLATLQNGLRAKLGQDVTVGIECKVEDSAFAGDEGTWDSVCGDVIDNNGAAWVLDGQ